MNRPSFRFPSAAAIVALALALLVAPAAQAGGPLANCASGQPFLWPAGGSAIPFNPDQGDLGPLSNADAVALTANAFGVWGAIPSSTVSYTNAGPLPVDVDITNFNPFLNPVAPDGLSAIVFDDTGEIFNLLFGPGSGILGFAGPEWINNVTCEILEGVSFLNGPSFVDPTAALDVMVHEFGHYTNLAHTVVNGQLYLGDTTGPTPFDTFGAPPALLGTETVETMYPFYFGPGSGTATVHPDDVAIVSTLYPAPGFFTSTATISGTIFAPDGTTRVSGVNVIARNVADPFGDAVSALSGDFTDGTTQADPVVGTYTLNGLTPGATYAVFVDEILQGGFSTTPQNPLPGPEEFWDLAESSDGSLDDPSVFDGITVAAGATSTADIIFNAPPPGTISLGDDATVQLPLPFAFDICGQTFNSVFVNSNGNLTFGTGSTDFSESIAELLSGPPRIAPLWDDLDPSSGGTVSFTSSKNRFTVRFDSVPEFFATTTNTFEVSLKRSADHIDIDYGTISATDGLAGVSCGGAITSGFETPTDLSALNGRINLHNQPAIYEVFGTGNTNDLSGDTLRFTGTTDYNDNWAEPNDSLGQARSISLPFDSVAVNRFTEIEPTGADVDFYSFSATGGQTLIAETVTGQLDTVLGLFDSAGNLVAADDDGGTGVLSRIVFELPSSGTYFLAVSTFPDTDFTGDGGSGGRYVLDIFTIDGQLLTLGDDTSVSVPIGFSFPYQGQSWSDVFVNSNGNLTFGAGSTDFSESVFDLLNGPPRIAALWDDLSPNNGGLVIVSRTATTFTVSFVGVPEFISTGSNTFAVTLDASGAVAIDYAGITATDGLVGVSEGGGAADPGATDLSAGGTFPVTGTTYELFSFSNPFDLDGSTVDFQ